VAWIFSACGTCRFCTSGRENLCSDFRATGRDANGGYAEYAAVPEAFVYEIPPVFGDAEAAPLLCAGAIGYRSLRLTDMRDGDNVGLTGFGASAHLVLKMVRYLYPKSKAFVFSRTEAEQQFAKELGAVWSGNAEDESPEKLHAVIDTTPAWGPLVGAMRNLERGGRLVVNAIRKEDRDKDALLSLDYSRDLWMEKEIKSVANITRKDVREFLELAATMKIKAEVQEYLLEDANTALLELRDRKIRGAKVLRIS
jgi:propanol-preferring alcohol dehydrogenase